MVRPKYKVIYADCPWKFSSKQVQRYKGVRFASLESREYPTMTLKDLCALPVKDITDKDCVLFLWVTDAHLGEGLEVIKAWGFRYITVGFVWSKRTTTGKQVATLGAWTMKNCELCLLATKGQMLQYKKANNVYQLVEELRQAHSEKPPETRERILRLFGDLSRIELFARQKVDGWDCIGNAINGEDIRVSLARIIAEQED